MTVHAPNFLSKFSRVGLSGPPPDSPSSTPNTHASMLFLLYELRNGLEWVNNTGTLIPKTTEVYFLLCWASGRHFVNFFVRQPLNRIFNFLGTDSARRDLPKNEIFKILSALFPGAKFFPKSPDIKIPFVQIDELGPSLYVKRVFTRFRYMSHLP